MKKYSVAMTAVWALGTFMLVLAVGLPAMLNAVDQGAGVGGKIAQPTLHVNGIDFTLQLANPSTQPSDKPAMVLSDLVAGQPLQLKLCALNTDEYDAKAGYSVEVYATPQARMGARSMPKPMQIWKQDGTVALDGSGSKTISLTTAAIPANQTISVQIVSGRNRINAMWGVAKGTGDAGQVRANGVEQGNFVVVLNSTTQPAN